MYSPNPPPSDPALLAGYLFDELKRISDEMRNPQFEIINLKQLNVAPNKRKDGDVLYADGTNFNPGSGAGLYWDNGTTRSKL